VALPDKGGIPPSRVHLPAGAWVTLLDFLIERFPRVPIPILERRLAAGEIVDDAGIPQRGASPHIGGRWLWYYREVDNETPVPFELEVLHHDDRLVVVDKPHFLASTPGGRYLRHTALVRLRNTLGLPDLSPIHRLDRETAGVLLFCVDPAYRGRYQVLFQQRDVRKVYEAVAVPPPGLIFPLVRHSCLKEVPGRFVMQETREVPNSETRVTLIRTLGPQGTALFQLEPVTGRKHQLRVHMSALGMPILHDPWYPVARGVDEPDDFDHPLQLLARAVEFRDPVDGRMRRFESARQLMAVAQAEASVAP
jgi:tRNA pseudouridine32 synthase/23S rRNA pseudouridine746 synthase